MSDLTYAYVAFVDENSPVYVMTCLDLLVENFDEFKTIRAMIPEMTMDFYNGIMVVNRIPKSMLSVFNTLMRMAMFNKVINVNATDQISFLLLLFRLGNKAQIKKFLGLTDIYCSTWKLLMDVDIDVTDFFDDEQKYTICMAIKSSFPEIDDAVYLSFYDVPYATRSYDFEYLRRIGVSEFVQWGGSLEREIRKSFGLPHELEYHPKIKQLDFPEKRVYDKESDSYYQCEKFGDKILLLQPRKATVATTAQLGGLQAGKMPAFEKEYIFNNIVENFIHCAITVTHRGKTTEMYLVYSTTHGAGCILKNRIRVDCDTDLIKYDQYYADYVFGRMCAKMLANGVYIRPTQESIDIQFEDARNRDMDGVD